METAMNGQGAKSPATPRETSSEHDPHFEPIITLPEVVVNTLEENEEELIKMRAKLFRYDTSESPPEWKERGTGEAKLLYNKERKTVRVVMRRDKTLKICANHFVATWMELKPNCGSDRAWVWSVSGDLTEETPRDELLAIRFANAENAMKWKDKFEDAKLLVVDRSMKNKNDNEDTDEDDEEKSDESDLSDSEDRIHTQASEETVSQDFGKLKISGETTEDDADKKVLEKEDEETVGKENLNESSDSHAEKQGQEIPDKKVGV